MFGNWQISHNVIGCLDVELYKKSKETLVVERADGSELWLNTTKQKQ